MAFTRFIVETHRGSIWQDVFASDVHRESMMVKIWPLETSPRVICFLQDPALMSKQMRKNTVEKRVNCFVHEAEEEINKVYGAQSKIWSNWLLYWLGARVVFADIVPSPSLMPVSLPVIYLCSCQHPLRIYQFILLLFLQSSVPVCLLFLHPHRPFPVFSHDPLFYHNSMASPAPAHPRGLDTWCTQANGDLMEAYIVQQEQKGQRAVLVGATSHTSTRHISTCSSLLTPEFFSLTPVMD